MKHQQETLFKVFLEKREWILTLKIGFDEFLLQNRGNAGHTLKLDHIESSIFTALTNLNIIILSNFSTHSTLTQKMVKNNNLKKLTERTHHGSFNFQTESLKINLETAYNTTSL